jgi:L-seryl-tRNA(Ser) seleniumtransferase
MFNRRRFIQSLSSVPLLGGWARRATAATVKRDYFKELGVKPFINAAGTYTTLTASLMPPEVVDAWEYASRQYVRLLDLQEAVGRRLAELLGCEAALVTSGAAGALTVGTAACITGTDQKLIRQLPDTTGMKNEVIVQKSHRYGYDHAVRNCGIRFVEVETAEELERAITPRTAMMLFFNANDPLGKIHAEEFVALGKKHNIPTFNDAAADTPPVGNLMKYTKMGFDLVTFSGGKGLRGPQSAGLLLGRKDLIEAAKLNSSPYSDSIGRGQKVNKEEILAMLVAVESYLKRDHEADWKEWERRVKVITDSVGKLPSVQAETYVPEIANHVPHLRLRWDPAVIRISVPEVVRQLREGDPSIEVVPSSKEDLQIGVWMLQPGEAQIVARRIREILKSAQA